MSVWTTGESKLFKSISCKKKENEIELRKKNNQPMKQVVTYGALCITWQLLEVSLFETLDC